MHDFSEQRKALSSACLGFKGAFLAGGALNSVFTKRPIADFDLYFRSEKAFQRACVQAFEDGYWCCHASPRSVTLSDSGTIYQFMHFDYFDTAEKIFDAFDFTICMAAWDIDTKDFVFHKDFLVDCASRTIRFHRKTRFPIISALRVLKYQERGYTIDRQNMLALALTVADLKLQSWEDLEAQIGGIYGNKISVVRDGDFSVDKVIDSLSVEYAEPMPGEVRDQIGSYEGLLQFLAESTGRPSLKVSEDQVDALFEAA
jgi:hypothetical protein